MHVSIGKRTHSTSPARNSRIFSIPAARQALRLRPRATSICNAPLEDCPRDHRGADRESFQ